MMADRTSHTTALGSETLRSLADEVRVPRRVRRSGVVRSWTIAWVGAAAIGIANAALREAVFSDLGELRAHQLSTITLLIFLAAYMWAVERWQSLPSARTALQVGVLWACLTVLFEFGLGLFVTKQPLAELLSNYNVIAGRMWALVPLWMAVGPAVLRRLHARIQEAVVVGM